MIVMIKIYDVGKIIGFCIMIIAFAFVVYFGFFQQQQSDIILWKIMSVFWFGGSLFWQSSFYGQAKLNQEK